MGHTANPQKINFLGTDDEFDPKMEFIFKPALQTTIQRVIDQQLNPNDPDFDTKRAMPATAEQVALAAEALKPHLVLMAQEAIEQAADATEHLPAASLTEGPGGRAQTKPSGPMTREQRRDLVFANVQAGKGFKGPVR